jgi:competence protein ComEC
MMIDAYKGSYDYLEHHGIRSLDLLVLTHSDTDHTYDAIEIIDKININQIVLSAYDTYDFYRHQGVLFVKSNDRLACGNTWIDVLGPIKDYPNSNDRSIVLQIKMLSMTFLLTGDIEEKAELDLIERYGNLLKSDVLKVGHHGSITSSSEIFLKTVMPEYAIISAGYQNRYNFPDPTILSRLMKQDVSIFRTDIQGTIIYNINEKRPKWKIHLPYQH